MSKKIMFHNPLSPGDAVVSSALIRDLHRSYPGQFVTGYSGVVEDYFWESPHITPMVRHDPEATEWRMTYDFIQKSNQNKMHFLYGYYHDFNEKFRLNVKMTEFKPDIHFSWYELDNPIVDGRYWVLAAGGKNDFITKWWDPKRWQQVIDMLQGKVTFVQVGEMNRTGWQPDLNNTVDLRGRTSFRELCRLILHSDGVLCGVTCLMHIAAACNRPCVVVAGGREAWWWEAYTRKNRDANMRSIYGVTWQPPEPDTMIDHIFLHSIGKYGLSCCSTGGCWKTRVNDGEPDKRCQHVLRGPTILQPKCLMHITPEQVAGGVQFYQDNGYSDQHLFIENFAEARKGRDVADIRGSLAQDILQPPVTICTLLYGPYLELHQRVLNSIVQNTKPGTFKIRIGMNELCKESKAWVNAFISKHPDVPVLIYDSVENIKKYPMMRRMFHDQVNPVDTRWLIWLDDDSHFTKNNWLDVLANCMQENYSHNCVMYGKRYFFELYSSQIQWVQEAKWYGKRPFRIHKRKDKKSGKEIQKVKADFITGGFWAVETEWVRRWDWPDVRINHNGGDVMMGEAIYQTGMDIKNFDYGVAISDAKRRGFSEKPAGAR